jgi:hypothetical protein
MRTFSTLSVIAILLTQGAVAQDTGASAAGVDVYDGFETPELSKVWATDRFVPGAVEMQTNFFRAGHAAARITVRTGEKFEAGINGNKDSERAELREATDLVSRENVAYEQSFSLFIPEDFPIVPTRLVLAQWKQYCPDGGDCSDDSPVVAIRYVAGQLRITHQIGAHATTLYETRDDLRGKWTDFRFQIRFSTGTNGYVKAWLNGSPVVAFRGVNAYAENATTGYTSPGYFYFKMGLYRDVMPEPMTIYVDEYRKRQLPKDQP